ncbi:NAD(P)H-dependent glycerol-3-phosphate dehydrogenase [Rhodovibrionaceae bacterium A322]
MKTDDPVNLKLSVLGGGAWGTALAQVAAAGGQSVRLWARNVDTVDEINRLKRNSRYLPDLPLSPLIEATGDLALACLEADVLLLVTPAQSLRELAGLLKPLLKPHQALVLCCKGIEQSSGMLPSEVLQELLPDQAVLALSGPTFAAEVTAGLPTAVTLGSPDIAQAQALASRLATPSFRPYASADLVGVEIGGAIKNVVAIACGIVEGRGLGQNARAALITRALAEITRLTLACGGQRETGMGLSGLGDLTLSATSPTSRNYAFGLRVGRGEPLAEIVAQAPVTEGLHTAAAAVALGKKKAVELPICSAVDAVLNRGAALDETIAGLLARPLKEEGQ